MSRTPPSHITSYKSPQAGLTSMIEQCAFLGNGIDYVQGAGGNLSFKEGDVLTIKASGTRLKDAVTKQIFIELPLTQARNEVLEREDLSDLVSTQNTPALRPSIETAIHSLLPHTFVTHVHSVGAISRAIDNNVQESSDSISDLGKVVFVGYAKPGIPLAHSILNELSSSTIDASQPLIVILGNHGIIVAARTAEEVQGILESVESRWRSRELATFEEPSKVSEGYVELAPAGTLNKLQAQVLLGGALTPDQVVFLGKTPFISSSVLGGPTSILINQDGSIWAPSNLSADAIEIAQSFVHIAQCSETSCTPVYLTAEQMDELLNWDAEKWRKAQER